MPPQPARTPPRQPALAQPRRAHRTISARRRRASCGHGNARRDARGRGRAISFDGGVRGVPMPKPAPSLEAMILAEAQRQHDERL